MGQGGPQQLMLARPPVRNLPRTEGEDEPKWMSARALGQLTGVPRGRRLGLPLSNGPLRAAWARKHQLLRPPLTHLVEERIPPEPAH